MNFGLKSKTISFIGLFFLASISLHSFAHIDEAPLTEGPQLECLTCHYEASSDVEVELALHLTVPSQRQPLSCLRRPVPASFSALVPPPPRP